VSCLLVLLALAAPRLAVILVWLFSDVFSQAFDSALWPILGFIFLPTTLLCYTAVQVWWGGDWNFYAVLALVIALMIDTSPARKKRGKK